MKLIVTGGAGFIGSAVIRYIVDQTDWTVINVDKLTYAGHLSTLQQIEGCNRYSFEQRDICDRQAMSEIFALYQPDAIMHLAAESHVDRSIGAPDDFIQTNIVGTYTLLEVAREYWLGLDVEKQSAFRFHHVSTDEVFGDLSPQCPAFTETTPYQPSSPYSASKAGSDHLVRAWGRTYGLPYVITNCSNNYGPFQFPEKLIPVVIRNALAGNPLPVYGDGQQIRDWLYVDDHAKALVKVITEGQIGETYNIGGHNEKTNLEVISSICTVLNELVEAMPSDIESFEQLIAFVEDRPGHDRRYAIDAEKIEQQLGWVPAESFETGIRKTVEWYLANMDWVEQVLAESSDKP